VIVISFPCQGYKHNFSIGIGQASQEFVDILHSELSCLPSVLQSIVKATEEPFVQCITEALSPQAVFEEGRVLLFGESLINIRPHTGSGAAHAARQAEALYRILQEEPGAFTADQRQKLLDEWEIDSLDYATKLYHLGKEMGEAALKSSHPMRGDLKS
jgi:2-polyprenyl-6-methoxyphenol hydroxylase-like FAD-dependent oxidoreductase